MDINIAFCRALLREVAKELTKHKVRVMRDGWVWKSGFRDQWEFHGPNNFYWNGSATNAYEARANGWQAWLRKFHPEREDEL